MKVKDLLAGLKGVNPELDVVGYSEDDDKLEVFAIVKAEVDQAEKMRTTDGKPYLKFGKSKGSSLHLLIELTAHD